MARREINLRDTDLKKAIKIMMAESKVESLADLARKVDTKETTFRSAINNNSMRLVDFLKVANALGYEVTVEDKG